MYCCKLQPFALVRAVIFLIKMKFPTVLICCSSKLTVSISHVWSEDEGAAAQSRPTAVLNTRLRCTIMIICSTVRTCWITEGAWVTEKHPACAHTHSQTYIYIYTHTNTHTYRPICVYIVYISINYQPSEFLNIGNLDVSKKSIIVHPYSAPQVWCLTEFPCLCTCTLCRDNKVEPTLS